MRLFYAKNESELGSFETIVVALPAPQAAEFLKHTPELGSLAEAVNMARCWAGM